MNKLEKRLHNQPGLKQRRRVLRNDGTRVEAALWTMLRKSQLRGRKFRRQHSIGRYVLDFYCPAEKLAVELDGAVHDDPLRRDYDGKREAFLGQRGVRVARFENKHVFEQPAVVLEAIAAYFQENEIFRNCPTNESASTQKSPPGQERCR